MVSSSDFACLMTPFSLPSSLSATQSGSNEPDGNRISDIAATDLFALDGPLFRGLSFWRHAALESAGALVAHSSCAR